MKANLIVAAVFVWAVCHVTDAADVVATVLPPNINNTACNETKLCWSNTTDCNGSSPSCIFTSFQVTNQTVFFELSGPGSGYLGLGIAKSNTSANDVVFVCANNNTNAPNNTFFYNTTIPDGTNLNNISVSTIYAVQGLVSNTTIQCTFNISTNLSIGSTNNFTLFNTNTFFSVISGVINGFQLQNAAKLFNFSATLVPMPKSMINNTGCNNTKLCLVTAKCVFGSISCFYTSVQQTNNSYFIELSGPTAGYVAVALTQNTTYMFMCGNNNITNSFTNQSFIVANGVYTPANITMNNVVGSVSTNPNLIQCTFNINNTFSPNITASNSTFVVEIYSGLLNGTVPLTRNTPYGSGNLVNLTSPVGTVIPANGSNSLISFWTNVLAVLFSVMSVYFITSPSP